MMEGCERYVVRVNYEWYGTEYTGQDSMRFDVFAPNEDVARVMAKQPILKHNNTYTINYMRVRQKDG